eukprot:jgi/Undpi1/410/HiC_scaffold_1.g00406.m1
MLRLGGLSRGDMQHCLEELSSINIPDDFKLKQIRSLLRFVREVGSLVGHIKQDSGFEGDTTSYLEILCAKEESDLIRRVSHTRVLRQDFDEKREEWRKQRQNVSNAIGAMTARALRFEDRERKTIALYALEFYKVGTIVFIHELNGTLSEKRHRSEISKIPMYADSILKMLKEIRKTVRASMKLQSESNVFAQFLEEWWSSVVQFLQQSSIVDAERNSREAMQTLKKLKGRQDENKKRERSRLLSKLDDNAGLNPVETKRLSELLAAQQSESSNTPDTMTNSKGQFTGSGQFTASGQSGGSGQYQGSNPACPRRGPLQRSPVGLGGGIKTRSVLKVCMENGGGRPSVGSRRSVASTVRSHASSTPSAEGDGGARSRVSWDEGSVGTAGTVDTMELPAFSGLPEGEGDSDGDSDGEGDDDDLVFQVADNVDLGAVDLFVCPQSPGAGGAQGQMTYQDQDELRLPSSAADPPSKRVEKERFSAALDYFRQEQQATATAAATAVGRMVSYGGE